MDYRDEILEKLTENFDLICKITDDNKNESYDVSLERIEEIINRVTGINIFKSKFEIRLTDFNKIAHGFGEIEDDDISDFEDLCREITNKTGEYLTVTDDDVYCEILEDLTDIHQQCVNLFADSARIVIEGSSDTINIDKTVNEMAGSIDSTIRYLDELMLNK